MFSKGLQCYDFHWYAVVKVCIEGATSQVQNLNLTTEFSRCNGCSQLSKALGDFEKNAPKFLLFRTLIDVGAQMGNIFKSALTSFERRKLTAYCVVRGNSF